MITIERGKACAHGTAAGSPWWTFLCILNTLIFTFFRDWVMAQVLPPLGLEEGKGEGVFSLVQLVAVVTREDLLTKLMVWVDQQAHHWDLMEVIQSHEYLYLTFLESSVPLCFLWATFCWRLDTRQLAANLLHRGHLSEVRARWASAESDCEGETETAGWKRSCHIPVWQIRKQRFQEQESHAWSPSAHWNWVFNENGSFQSLFTALETASKSNCLTFYSTKNFLPSLFYH